MSLPSTVTVFPVPGAISDTGQAFTNVDMAGLLARVIWSVKLRAGRASRPSAAPSPASGKRASGAQRGAQLARQHVDRPARPAGQLLPPLALGLEALIAHQVAPRGDGARD